MTSASAMPVQCCYQVSYEESAMKELLLNATSNKCIKVRLVKWGEIILGGNWLKHTIDCSVVVATVVIAA